MKQRKSNASIEKTRNDRRNAHIHFQNQWKITVLTALLLALLAGCTLPAPKPQQTTGSQTDVTQQPAQPTTEQTTAPAEPAYRWEAVQAIDCVHPAYLSGIRPLSGTLAAVCGTDFDTWVTTVQVVDLAADTVKSEIQLDGMWEPNTQTFADGRLALRNRDQNAWKFFDTSLRETGTLQAADLDGFFSADGSGYFYLNGGVLFRMDTGSGVIERVRLDVDLRFSELSAYDSRTGRMAALFDRSPYTEEKGTAIFNPETGAFFMVNADKYQTFFQPSGVHLIAFDLDAMRYSALGGQNDGDFLLAKNGRFLEDGVLYGIPDAPCMMNTSQNTTLYRFDSAAGSVQAAPLAAAGLTGELYQASWLPEEEVLAGAVYEDGAFRLYVISPAALTFSSEATAAQTASPLTVQRELADVYWQALKGPDVATRLQTLRQKADALEAAYGVRILMSNQCETPAALCAYPSAMSDTLGDAEEEKRIGFALERLERSLAMYPAGFFEQFTNDMGEGGVRFLLVGAIESDFNVVDVTFEHGAWQNIVLDIRVTFDLEGTICHEIWHATENKIVQKTANAFDDARWSVMNPDGFSYYFDPSSAQPDPLRWTFFGDGSEGVYFVDTYARVDAREDRARIMEYFMTHGTEARSLIQAPAIRAKLQYMCDAVRAAFDTTGWTQVRWENLL